MKRFLIVLVLLAALLGGHAEEVAKQEQACVCKEGEKNCPCLAQQKQKGNKASIKVNVKVSATVPRLSKKEVLKRLSAKMKLKKLAPKEKILLGKLKLEFQAVKAKMKSLKGKLHKIPQAQKAKLTLVKKDYKFKCVELKKSIIETKAKLAEMERKYKEECLKQASEKEVKANKIIEELTPKIDAIKAQIKENVETLKVAPKKDIPFLQKKIAGLEKALKKLMVKFEKAKTFLVKLQAAKEKGEDRKQKKEESGLEKKLEKKDKKHAELKIVKKKLVLKIGNLSKAVKAINMVLLGKGVSSKVKRAKTQELKTVTHQLNIAKAKLDKIIKKEAEIKKFKEEGTKRLELIKKNLKEAKEKKECLKLQKKLTAELVLMKKLKADFEKECVKAVKTQKKKHITKVLDIKKQIDLLKAKIEGIKKAIKKAPHNQRKKLVGKVRELERILELKRKSLTKTKTKLKKIKQKAKKSTRKVRRILERKKIKLIEKVAKTKKDIIDYVKQTNLLKLQHEKACEGALANEKEKSREAIAEIKSKLELGQKYAKNVENALKNTKEIADLTEKAESFKKQSLETTDPKLKAELVKQEATMRSRLIKEKKELEDNKREAKALENELAQKTKKELINQKKFNEKAEREMEKLMKASLAKEQSLQNELKKAGDKAVQDALKLELDIEKKKLKNFNIKIQEFQQEKTSLEHEIDLEKKAAIQRKREAELQDALMAKQMKNQETILRSNLALKFTKDKKEKMASQTSLLEKELAEHKKKLSLAQAEYTTYKVALKAGGKKKTP